MQWAELTGDDFPGAVEKAGGVCLLPLSVIERHGHHMPLGTDMYIGAELCRRAAALEPAIVFPDNIFTQIPEARHVAGTISIDYDLILKLLENICREISRNGMKKILIVNAHGGNSSLVRFFNEIQLYSKRDYVVYHVNSYALRGSVMEVPWKREGDFHAGAGETSTLLSFRSDLMHMDRIPTDEEGQPRKRLSAIQEAGLHTGIWWYADFPTHYAGDANQADAEVGGRLLDAMAEGLARAIRAVKADEVTQQIQDQFFDESDKPA